MRKADRERARLRLALTRAASALHAIAANIRAMDMPMTIELAGTHSIAFCAERAARDALDAPKGDGR